MMSRTFWKQTFGRLFTRRRLVPAKRRHGCFVPSIESLTERIVPAVTASFFAGTNTLTVIGDNLDNTITVSRNAAGVLLVNGGAVAITGGQATVANTARIQVFGLGGNDSITLNEALGALPAANLFGGTGNDVLVGGSGADQLFGESGNDALLGKGGSDLLFGGNDNDTLTGGDADDQAFGQSGNDRFVWNPGDDTDLNEGGDGIDTIEVNGGNGAESFTVTANGSRVRFDRIDPAPFSLDIGTSEKLVVNANGGNDSFSAGNGLAALVAITVDGGAGNDTLRGGDGADVLFGGIGDDFVDGNGGNDIALLGAGNDVFQWDPGDGSDTVEGQAGIDRMAFNGSNISENITLSANGGRLRFFRDVANITMDLDDVETVDFNALGGADTITVNDLTGTDVTRVNLNLAGSPGGTSGDAQADTVIVNATNGNNSLGVQGAGTAFSVTGLTAQVHGQFSEADRDNLVINALGGNDTVNASNLPAGLVRLTVDGGIGNDTILGSAGADVLLGGDGNDLIDGNQGDDVALMGAGNDTFIWNPGDGNDVVEGQDGLDTMLFTGSNISENVDLSANGGRLRFFRDVANVVMDVNDVETVTFDALGGADTITVNDLAGTDVTLVNVRLAGLLAGKTGDLQADHVIVKGTSGADRITVAGAAGNLTVSGLAAQVKVYTSEGARDQVTVDALGGDDNVDARALAANVTSLNLNGGSGVDVLIGSEGIDAVNGGAGDDVALLGAGNDTFVWNPGDGSDTVEGQEGIDRMVFNGSNVSENITLSANGGRLRFFRDVANITMDLDDVETVDFNALGGADTITVNDLTGTDVTRVNLNLAGSPGGTTGDAQADTVIVNGTNGDDALSVAGGPTGVSVLGLAAQVNITGSEPANDRLNVNVLGGDDVVQASGLLAGAIQLTADGGAGDDILSGSKGDDVLLGGDGDDVLLGGPGLDILDGGSGSNVVIQG